MASTTVPSQAHMIAPEIPTSDDTEGKTPLPVADGPSSDTLVEKDPEKQTPESTGSTSGAEEADDVQQYPPARTVILIMLSLYLVMFLVALVSVSNTTMVDESAKRGRMTALLPTRRCL